MSSWALDKLKSLQTTQAPPEKKLTWAESKLKQLQVEKKPIEPPAPKQNAFDRPVEQHKLGKPDIEAGIAQGKIDEAKWVERQAQDLEMATAIKDFAGKKVQELTVSKPPPKWEKTIIVNAQGDEVEGMKRSTESLQHDLAIKTYERIAEMKPEEMGDFIDGFRSGGDKGLDVEGTLRLLPFVGAFIDYNETDLLNKAAMAGATTPSAQELLTAKNAQLQMQQLVNTGRWEDVGQLMSQMVPFAGEFLVTRGVGGSTATGARGLAAEIIKDSPNAAKVLKGFAAASKSGLGSATLQSAANVPRTAATAEARQTPEMGGLGLNEQGEVAAKPITEEAKAKVEGTWEATLKAFGSGVVENFTERFGGYADDIFRGLKARGVNITKEALEKQLANVGESGMTTIQKKLKEVGVDGFIGEVFLEEIPSQVGTSLVTGDELNLDYDQLLNLGIAAGIPGAASTLSTVPKALNSLFNKPVAKAEESKPITQTDKFEVTGEILIQKVSTGKHIAADNIELTEYSTGLTYKKTGKPVIVHEINDGKSIMFQTPEGEFVGTSVESVADQVQKAGLPQVTAGQIAEAETVIGAGGYNKASFQRALTEVFHYPKKQAETIATIADRMVQTIAKRQDITPDQAYQQIKLAKGVINAAGEIIEEKIVKKVAPSKADKALAAKLKMPAKELVEAEIDAETGKYVNPPLQETQEGVLGAYQPTGGGKGIIYAFTGADVTTALHELAHHYELNALNDKEKAAIEKWSKAKAGTVGFSEAFARGFETFLKSGDVKSPEMKTAFSKFRTYLTDLINSWIDTGRPLSKSMEKVYRSMLGEEGVQKLKQKSNAIQERGSEEIPVQPTPGHSEAVGEGVSKQEEVADENKEEVQVKEEVTPPQAINGDTSMKQPAMQPAKAETAAAYVEKLKKEPKPKAPKVKKRTIEEQPSQDMESSSEAVVEALKGLDFVPDNVADLTEFVASLDEEGRPLGPGKAFAIVQQMQAEGFIEINGKRIKPLFQRRPLLQEKNDYISDSQKQVLNAVRKAADEYNPVDAMKAEGFGSFREWVKTIEQAAKGDAAATAKAIANALNITVEEAKNVYASIKGVTAPKLGSDAKGFFEAWSGGRGAIFSQYGKAWPHLVNQMKNIKLKDTVNPLNWLRIISLPVSGFMSIVQSAKTLALGNIESQFITPRMRALGDWLADKAKDGVIHRNFFIRNITQAMQGFYRGLTYTSSGVEAQSRLRGGINEGHVLAQKLMSEMYNLVGRDGVKLARVHAVLDPEVYVETEYEGITEASLSADERLLYQTLKDNMALLHDHSFARGYISEETYLKNKNSGGYFGRQYEEILDSQMYGDDVDKAFGSVRTDFSLYTKRKDFAEVGLTIEKDPVFIAAQRMAKAIANQAVTDYADYIADTQNSKIITYSQADFEGLNAKRKQDNKGPIKGFTLLRGYEKGGGVYGFLTNRYVPNYVAYDFKGFFLTSKLGQYTYNAIKMYDRHWIRQEIKKTLTAYNPAVFVGNQSSNYTFAFVNDVDLFNYNIMLSEASKSIEEKDTVYNKLVAAGLIGADVATDEYAPLRQRLAVEQSSPTLGKEARKVLDKIITAYSQTDDKAKIAAYRVKTEVQGKSSEQAITEILSGFQNYSNVGMFFDMASKLPVFGNAFAKFLGDVQRVAVSSIAYRPLTTAAYIGTIYGLQALASAASGEDDESEAIREGRPYQPRIPFLGMPLTFKIGGKEINFARYIFPFTMYDKGESTEGMWHTFSELMPIQPYVNNGPGKPGYLKFSDPVLGPMFSLIFDKDFRGMSIANPTKTAASDQQAWNQAEFLIRSFGWLPTTATDAYHIWKEGEDYYGRNRTISDRIISIVIRVEEFNDPEVRNTMMKQIRNLNYDVERIHDKANKLLRDGNKNIQAIQNNSTLTEAQRDRQMRNEVSNVQKSLLELTDEYKAANKKLTDAASYATDVAEKMNKKKP